MGAEARKEPRTAAEWVFIICTNYRLHVPDDADGCMFCTEFEGALIAFARQQVEIERSRWISDQCTANQAGQVMGRMEGYMEGWNAALELAAQTVAALYPEVKEHYYTFEIGNVRADAAAAIRALCPLTP